MENNSHSASIQNISETCKKYLDVVSEENILHSCQTLSGQYFDSSELSRYEKALFLFDGKSISLNEEIKKLLSSENLCSVWLSDLIQYSLMRYQDEFGAKDYDFPFFKLYSDYSMRDTALLCNYTKIHSSFRGQGLITSAKPDYFIFVNLHKNADIKESINYKDKFISPGVFQWQSPNSTTQDSEIGKNIIFSYKRRINLHLFVRKFEEVEGVTQPFVYLGKVVPLSDTAEGNKPITIQFALENRVPDELYLDFTTRTDMLGKLENE